MTSQFNQSVFPTISFLYFYTVFIIALVSAIILCVCLGFICFGLCCLLEYSLGPGVPVSTLCPPMPSIVPGSSGYSGNAC